MANAKYDPRLDRLASQFMRGQESPHGWRYRAQEAISFGPGHLRIWWCTDDMGTDPAEIDIKRTARGTRIMLWGDNKPIYLLPEPFDSIIARLEQRSHNGAVPKSFDEFTEFLGLRLG